MTTDSKSRSNSFALAEQALRRLAEHRLAPSPQNYTVFFHYCAADLPDLTRLVERQIAETPTLTQQHLTEFFNRFFSIDNQATAVESAADRTQSAISKLLDLLTQAGVDTGRYHQSLKSFQAELTVTRTVDQISHLLDAIAEETKTIVDGHSRLQADLGATSKQLESMRADLHKARTEAMTDGLTGLPNRKAFDAALGEATAAAVLETEPLALLMIDIDHFKKFNDAHGHLVGDRVLKLVGKTLRECVKGRDTPARYGGEEFAIILPETTLNNAITVGNHVRKTVGSRRIINRSTSEDFGTITLSVGATQYVPGEPLAEFIKRADVALYAAKRNGRNQVCVEPPPAKTSAA